jgi:hypothetical protein
MSMPLPPTHWIYGDPSVENKGDGWSFEPPPMPVRLGEGDQILILRGEDVATAERVFAARQALSGKPIPQPMDRHAFADMLRRAGKYAVRAATMKGKDMDFDPDALIQNLITGMVGYCTANGLDETDSWANPPSEVQEQEAKQS